MIAPMRFYRFASPDSTRGTAEWAPTCNRFGNSEPCLLKPKDHDTSKWRSAPLSILLRQRKVQDIVWTWFSEPVLQERVHRLFQEHGFTGYEVAPVQARFKRYKDLQPPKLLEMVVTGWGGSNTRKAGFKRIEHCKSCGLQVYKGPADPKLLIDESQWDGSDFFFVWPFPLYIFVTERVAEVVRNEKLTGVRLIALGEMKPIDGAAPGGLRKWLPEPWASDIGKPLGIY